MKINDHELIKIYGGAINGTLINAFARLLDLAIEIGKMIGYSLQRLIK
ncbi:unknown [Mycoplasma sp. CAG:776]|nr:unknown [Mycoplasma sp. CAG:776]